MDSRHQELDFWDKMLNKTIEAESKAALQSPTSICKRDAHCWKGKRPDKKEETSKLVKEKKAKPADSQPTPSAGTQSLGQNSYRT